MNPGDSYVVELEVFIPSDQQPRCVVRGRLVAIGGAVTGSDVAWCGVEGGRFEAGVGQDVGGDSAHAEALASPWTACGSV